MPLKRPTNPEPASDADFVEDLVKKSLSINPRLKGGMRTQQYLEKLRQQALAEGKGPSASAPAPAAPPAASAPAAASSSLNDKKSRTLSMFLDQRSEDYDQRAAAIRSRRAELDKEEAALKQEAIDDIVDILTVVSHGESVLELQPVLGKYRGFLGTLGVADRDLLKMVKRR